MNWNCFFSDIMLRTLTVHDILKHSARLRLPSDWSDSKKMKHVNRILKLLKLDSIKGSVIGDQEQVSQFSFNIIILNISFIERY